MKIRISKKILIIITIFLLILLIFIPKCFAGIAPGDITGNPSSTPDVNVDFVDKLAGIIRTIGIFIAVGVIMIIGIKYMTGSLEEKANYKKSMFPYLIGCVLLFGASTIAPQIMGTFKENQNAEDIGNLILGIIQVVGTFVAVATLMILGIKYMLGSLEERASYKKSMLPYIVGAVLLFAGVNITSVIANNVMYGDYNPEQASTAAHSFTSSHTDAEIQTEYERAKEAYLKAVNAEKRNDDMVQYWSKYMTALDSYLKNN